MSTDYDIVSKLFEIHSKMALLCQIDPELITIDPDNYSQEAKRALEGVRLLSQDISREIYKIIVDINS